jgi:hypothetical protein
LFFLSLGFGIYGIASETTPVWFFGIALYISLPIGLGLGYFYVRCRRILLDNTGITIMGCLREKLIPYSSIAQVVSADTPRAGTSTWLFDKSNRILGKFDGSLLGYRSLMAEVEQRVRPFQTLIFKRGSFGPWEFRVAGDSHWATGEIPGFTQMIGARYRWVMRVGYALIVIFIAISIWLNYFDGFDKLTAP